jgi:uncharacterized membrane protein
MASTHRTDRYTTPDRPLHGWGIGVLTTALWIVVFVGTAYLVWATTHGR